MGNRRRLSTTTTCTDSTVRDRESLFNCVYIPVRALGTVCMYLCVCAGKSLVWACVDQKGDVPSPREGAILV